MNSTAKAANHSPALRLLGRALIAAFCVSIVAFALPFQPRSPNWGVLLSNRIVDEFPLILAGVALLRFSAMNDVRKANESDETDDTDALERDQGSRWISRISLIGIGLIALWQVILFFGILRDIDQQSASVLTQINQRASKLSELVQRAPDSAIQRLLQESRKALGNKAAKPNTSPLQELSENIQRQTQISINTTYANANQAKFRLTKDTGRILLLCLIYGIALYGMASIL